MKNSGTWSSRHYVSLVRLWKRAHKSRDDDLKRQIDRACDYLTRRQLRRQPKQGARP